mgnify:CR=1 FL=1|tara:strand:- start:36392 stop:37273 length:882 start_codon:yes stop_codon:yes gene_type:complete
MKKNNKKIYLENAKVLHQLSYKGNQYITRLEVPKCSKSAIPGSFVHISCDQSIPMRRPISIMEINTNENWIDLLYKPIGNGLESLAKKKLGDTISCLGPIGNGFDIKKERSNILAIGGGVGIPPIYFLANHLRKNKDFNLLVLMGSEVPFPFKTSKAKTKINGIPKNVFSVIDKIQSLGIQSRLASSANLEGCFNGYVTQLAEEWLINKDNHELNNIQIMACGPEPMLEATAKLAKKFNLPCQIAVEEFMACGVGGCAGCTIEIRTKYGPQMKRVCVDGPVFNADEVYSSIFI